MEETTKDIVKKENKKKDSKKSSSPNFFDGVKMEFKKISWPDRKTTFKQSVAVVIISVVVGLVIAVLDFGAKAGINELTSIDFDSKTSTSITAPATNDTGVINTDNSSDNN